MAPSGTTIFCPTPPHQLGSAALAIARLAIHSDRAILSANPASWHDFLENITSQSPHADDLMPPMLRQQAENPILHPVVMAHEDLCRAVHGSLDNWTLHAVDTHLSGYLDADRDPGHRIGFRTQLKLRARMAQVWADWREHFQREPELLGRFLRLTVCAQDQADSVDEAYTLVGPKRLKAIVRSTAVVLAIAVGWDPLQPRAVRPGNLVRTLPGGSTRTGHTCAADRIQGDSIAISAAKFAWNTNFVVLPTVNGPTWIAEFVSESLAKTNDGPPRLTEVDDRTNIVLTVDEAFINAVQAGSDALADLLRRLDEAHYRRLTEGIERTGE